VQIVLLIANSSGDNILE